MTAAADGPSTPGTTTDGGALEARPVELETALADFARLTDGGDGVTRLAHTPTERRAHSLFADRMRGLGLRAWTDAVGNTIAELDPTHPGPAPAVGTGSHLDSVPLGGAYDGTYGVVAALEVARLAVTHDLPRRRPWRFVAFAAEEGARFGSACNGSKVVAGVADAADLHRWHDVDGTTMAQAMTDVGLAPDRAHEARWEPDRWHAFVELHIEQGPLLEDLGATIGVVDRISGSSRAAVVLHGVASHTGATPMHLRVDALAAAAACVLATEAAANDGETRATVGRMEVLPGSMTTIPGEVRFTLDVRGVDARAQRAVLDHLLAEYERLGRERGVAVEYEVLASADPVLLPRAVTDVVARAAAELALPAVTMTSGASHDAQMISRVTPTGMIFVPSRGGLSHVPQEWTSGTHLAAGTTALLRTMQLLDAEGAMTPADGGEPLRHLPGVRVLGSPEVVDLTVRDGVLADVTPSRVPHERARVLLPALVDLHTHLREPGGEAAETIASGTRAAAAGGYSDVFAMANTVPVTDTVAAVRRMREIAADGVWARVHPVGALTHALAGERLTDLAAMAAAGVRLFSDDGRCLEDVALLAEAMTTLARTGGVLAQHAQSTALAGSGVVNDAVAHLVDAPGWPLVGEEAIIARDVAVARATGAHLHVCHVSSGFGAAILGLGRAHGARVTGEVTPHHLVLHDTDAVAAGPALKVNPPLRSGDDAGNLRHALRTGLLDVVATDHAPHEAERKRGTWRTAAFGLTGLETALDVVAEVFTDPTSGEVDWPAVARVTSVVPARIGGLADRAGRPVAVGEPATWAVVGPGDGVVQGHEQHTRSANTPFTGRAVRHRVELTVVDGVVTHRA
ncbi:allantoate amidohydrolase [Litorihabitans aurantiacus]|uniref:Dihydroorotase catalytic domain-containing protein n=1 Tax=Litorihabitans aurantiacus TaxID=1930061 RepID=A0AA37XAU3_9MICO|nr:allantoate amidohydrolase [Litorihabitans aurantiacus]GMA30494.1 hypothetical protein GCM10025875_04860 [Litorihabitans aurantiacus]